MWFTCRPATGREQNAGDGRSETRRRGLRSGLWRRPNRRYCGQEYGVKAVGFDIDPQRVKEALNNLRSNKVEHLVTIKQADIFTLDLRAASVVTLYPSARSERQTDAPARKA